MFFTDRQPIDRHLVLQGLGYGKTQPDKHMALYLQDQCEAVMRASAPRWNYARFALRPGCVLEGPGLVLPGADIEKHLEGCHAVYLLALTLGTGIERDIRAAEATDMQKAVVLDIGASVLIEQYADAADAVLRAEAKKRGEFITGRFSPGYGDFPISLQPDFIRLTDAARSIGLSANESFILLPRKSITAVIGVSASEVKGYLAGCAQCPLIEKCAFPQTGAGALCGKTSKQEAP